MGSGPGRGACSPSVYAVLCILAIHGTATSSVVTCKPQVCCLSWCSCRTPWQGTWLALSTTKEISVDPSLLFTQGLLRLDAPYEPPARRSPALPFCKQFSPCTCCNASHAAALARDVGAALADDSLSASCKAVVAQLACRCGLTCRLVKGLKNYAVGMCQRPVCVATCHVAQH